MADEIISPEPADSPNEGFSVSTGGLTVLHTGSAIVSLVESPSAILRLDDLTYEIVLEQDAENPRASTKSTGPKTLRITFASKSTNSVTRAPLRVGTYRQRELFLALASTSYGANASNQLLTYTLLQGAVVKRGESK